MDGFNPLPIFDMFYFAFLLLVMVAPIMVPLLLAMLFLRWLEVRVFGLRRRHTQDNVIYIVNQNTVNVDTKERKK